MPRTVTVPSMRWFWFRKVLRMWVLSTLWCSLVSTWISFVGLGFKHLIPDVILSVCSSPNPTPYNSPYVIPIYTPIMVPSLLLSSLTTSTTCEAVDEFACGGFPKLGYPFGGPNFKDSSIFGSMLGSPFFGKLPSRAPRAVCHICKEHVSRTHKNCCCRDMSLGVR